jgi:hypothetical protein
MRDPKLMKMPELFSERLFNIPEYQRGYSWGKKQRKDLFDDIKKLYRKYQNNSDITHFMSTIVCLQKAEKEKIAAKDYTYFDVVDGQQRLTTLVILLKSISLLSEKFKDTNIRTAIDDLEKLLVKPNNAAIAILQTNHDAKLIFSSYIKTGEIKSLKGQKSVTNADINLHDAIIESNNFIEEWCNEEKLPLSELLYIINNKLNFLFYALDDEAVVYNTFEILNSRGLIVAWVDKLKSILMGIAFENSNTKQSTGEMHNIWQDIYETIEEDIAIGSSAIRFLATILSENENKSKILSDEDSVGVLSRYSQSKEKQDLPVQCSKMILDWTQAIKELLSDNAKKAVTQIQHARFLAVSIMLSKKFSDKEKEKLLEAWEKATFVIFGLNQKDSRVSIGTYVQTAIEIYKGDITFEAAQIKIQRFTENFNIDLAIEMLKETDCYNDWAEETRYLFYKRELYLLNQKLSTKITWDKIWHEQSRDTIEHILPQSDNKIGLDELPNSRNKKGIYKHRLGNLLVIDSSKNSSLKDKPALKKQDDYNDLSIEKEVRELIKKHKGWTREVVDKRENDLFEWIKIEWGDISKQEV